MDLGNCKHERAVTMSFQKNDLDSLRSHFKAKNTHPIKIVHALNFCFVREVSFTAEHLTVSLKKN